MEETRQTRCSTRFITDLDMIPDDPRDVQPRAYDGTCLTDPQLHFKVG